MIKRKEIYISVRVFGSFKNIELKPSGTSHLYCIDIYGDTYKNQTDYWELVEVKE